MTKVTTISQQRLNDAPKPKLASEQVHIHKFGGSSLANAVAIKRVVGIIQQHARLHDIIVVSANGDTTDHLLALYRAAIEHDEVLLSAIEQLIVKHQALIDELLTTQSELHQQLSEQLTQDALALTALLTQQVERHYHNILAFGEVWSARLLAAVLSQQVCPAQAVDARACLTIADNDQYLLDETQSQQLLSKQLPAQKLAIVTGFLARDLQGETITLGRNGSDFSATLLAKLLNASEVTIWSDVDGIYSADPRLVPSALKLHRIPKQVAQELGRLGNPVLHQKTLEPLTAKSCRLKLASSYQPENSGSEVGDFGELAQQGLSVTFINDVLLYQSSAFTTETLANIAELTAVYCFDSKAQYVVAPAQAQAVITAQVSSQGQPLTVTPVSILAVVGYQVSQRKNVLLRLQKALSQTQPAWQINHQSGHSIQAIIKNECQIDTLNRVHQKVTKHARQIGVVVAGVGNIGECFLQQFNEQLQQQTSLENVHLYGLLNSRQFLLDDNAIELEQVWQRFADEAQAYQAETLVEQLAQHPFDELIVIDITASQQFSELYGQLFSAGLHVISANKWAAADTPENYNELQQLTQQHKVKWLINTTVGAGLPVNYALQDLVQSGDSIQAISGIFSGTLSWLFAQFDGSKPFAEVLLAAKAQGITEPDPREDLSGQDVRRKLLILARLAGFDLALEDIACENLVPENLRELPLDEFLAQAAQLNERFDKLLASAQKQNQVLRYVAQFKQTKQGIKANVGLQQVAQTEPLANITAGDNVFVIQSQFYLQNPLIIQGPGAGREVTAAGIHSDLVRLCQQINQRPVQVKLKGVCHEL